MIYVIGILAGLLIAVVVFLVRALDDLRIERQALAIWKEDYFELRREFRELKYYQKSPDNESLPVKGVPS